MASRAMSLSGRSSTSRMWTRSSAGDGEGATSVRAATGACGGRLISGHLAVEPLRKLLVVRLVRREADGLLGPQAEEPELHEAPVEQPVDALLEAPVEVDEDVPADDQVELVEGAVSGQVVLGE